jgi:hypothetical protein
MVMEAIPCAKYIAKCGEESGVKLPPLQVNAQGDRDYAAVQYNGDER